MITIAGWLGPYGDEPGYNNEISYDLVEAGYSEPVTLAEANDYLRLNSNEVQDALVERLIVAARQAFEKAAGRISVVPKTATLWFSNPEGMYPIPFGPVQSVQGLFDSGGTEIVADNYQLIGNEFPKLRSPNQCAMKMEYTVGMYMPPEDIKTAILDQVKFTFENRGTDSDTPALCKKAWAVAQRWNRYGFTA